MEELIEELKKKAKTYVDTPENEDKILIPFIQKILLLPMKERRKLLPAIKELEYIKYGSCITSCDNATARFLGAVQLVSDNKRGMSQAYFLDFRLLCRLLPLYCPDWLTDFVNESPTSYKNFNVTYRECMQLIEMGYLKDLSPEFIARRFAECIMVEYRDSKRIYRTYDSSLDFY